MSVLKELKRRNVLRVAGFYIIASWVILQVAELLFDTMGLPQNWIRLVLALLILGLPLVVVFSWVFELTPEGIKKETEVDRSLSQTSQTGKKLNLATIAVVLIGVGLLAATHFLTGKSEDNSVNHVPSSAVLESEIPVVAVLPFMATGSDDGGFLATGLHDDLLTRLAKLGVFKVISRTSVMEYAQTTKNIRQIGEELDAGYILEGSVQARGNRIRVNAQFIDAGTDEHIWADTYDHQLTAENLFDIQGQLAQSIARELHVTLSESDQKLINEIPTHNLAAYNAYLRGLEQRDRGGHTTTNTALVAVEFERAVALDPDFALAWAQLAIERARQAQSTTSESLRLASRQARATAQRLQADLPEVEMANIVYLYRAEFEYEKALAALEIFQARHVLTADQIMLKAYLLRRVGKIEQAHAEAREARKLNPRSIQIASQLIPIAWQSGDCTAAGQHAKNALALHPNAVPVRTAAAEYELQCTADVEEATRLLDGMKVTGFFGQFTIIRAAEISRDFEGLLSYLEPYTDDSRLMFSRRAKLFKAKALYELNRPDEAQQVLDSLAVAFQAEEEKAAYAQRMSFSLRRAAYYALRADVENTRHWIAETKRWFVVERKADHADAPFMRTTYAEFFAQVGLYDEAVEELRLMLSQPSGNTFLFVDSLPAFDVLKNHAGYIELKKRYGEQRH